MCKGNIKIENLFFKDFEKKFSESMIKAIDRSNLSEDLIIQKLNPIIDDLISKYEETMSSFYLEYSKFKLNGFLKNHLKNQETNLLKYKDSFESFIMYINACVILFNKISEEVGKGGTENVLGIRISLYGIILRRAIEIVDLLIVGHIQASMIIWRSLYENSISLLTLVEGDNEELTKRFVDHSFRNKKRKINSYRSTYKDLNFKPLSTSDISYIEKEEDRLKKIYGEKFISNYFGWADILFNNKADLKQLENFTGMSRFGSFYTLCCEASHSNLNEFENYMEGNKIVLEKLLSTNINHKNLVDPMQFTLAILDEVNIYITYEFSIESERKANYLLLKKMFERLLNTFDNIVSD